MPNKQRPRQARDHWDARQPKKCKSTTNKRTPISSSLSSLNIAASNFRRPPSTHRPRRQRASTRRDGVTRDSGYNFRERVKGKDLDLSAKEHEDGSPVGVNPKDQVTTQDQGMGSNVEAETMFHAPVDPATVQENRRRLRESEEMARRKAIAKYKLTNDTEVFRPFLAPFIASGEYKGDLGEWQWDAEVERYWRINRTTGTKVWEPLWESFV